MRTGSSFGVRSFGIMLVLCGAVACDPSDDPAIKPAPDQPSGVSSRQHDESQCDMGGAGFLSSVIAKAPDGYTRMANWNLALVQEVQRFSESANSDYGPIVCMVPVDNLATLGDTEFSQSEGAVVAFIYLHEPVSGRQAYSNLHLSAAGLYCLILKGDPDNATMDAHIVPVASSQCGTINTNNRVAATPTLPGFATTEADFAPTARFVLKENHQPGIAIRCRDRLCLIARSGVPASRAHTVPSGGPDRVRRAVFTWYDQQWLAVTNTAHPPLNLKATLKASIVPHADLGRYTDIQFTGAAPLPVAYVFIGAAATGKYASKWAFANVGPNQPNVIALKNTGGVWSAYVNNVLNPNLRVTRAPHPGLILGVVRWKWSDTDEEAWVRCGEGCCSIEPT
jgi:hypothetical protein